MKCADILPIARDCQDPGIWGFSHKRIFREICTYGGAGAGAGAGAVTVSVWDV